MSSPLMPYVTQLITSQRLLAWRRKLAEKRRRRNGQPHKVTVYLRLTDAYSYLLLQVLPQLAQRFGLQYEFRTVLSMQPDMFPAPHMWQQQAWLSGRYLADLYQLDFPAQPPEYTDEYSRAVTAQLLHWELQPGYWNNALALFEAYWQGDTARLEQLLDQRVVANVECYQHHLQANEQLLQSKGHYLSAMLHYAGEWYWGLDRLWHFEQRLLALTGAGGKPEFERSFNQFCQGQSSAVSEAAKAVPVRLYFSLRSPYSYLGLVRARQMAQHYGVTLELKPVLPMVMRRMQVPRAKRFYITQDVKRESLKYGLPFGRVADPLGAGVERCYALHAYAHSQGKALDLMESCARGVWAEGIRADTDQGLQQMVQRAGLDWEVARGLLGNEDWRLMAQENLADMYAAGVWGVPSFGYGELALFGQDRLDCIERAILAAS